MLYIEPNLDALEKHYENVRCLIRRKLGKPNCLNVDCQICSKKFQVLSNIPDLIKQLFTEEWILEILIKGKPRDLISLNKELTDEICPGFDVFEHKRLLKKKKDDLKSNEKHYVDYIRPFVSAIERIFAYDSWFSKSESNDYGAYQLAKLLNRNTCTYCNRIYTNTMTGKGSEKVMRPQFDHWYPKTHFPMLALSFYNLIPSCSVCNSSSKGSKIFDINKESHPYLDENQSNDFYFDYNPYLALDNYEIEIKSSKPSDNKTKNTLEKLNIHTMYNAHHSELRDLIKIRDSYSKDYLDILKGQFPSLDLTDNEIYRLAFGTELDPKDFHKRPFSKFKSDILKQLEIINE